MKIWYNSLLMTQPFPMINNTSFIICVKNEPVYYLPSLKGNVWVLHAYCF